MPFKIKDGLKIGNKDVFDNNGIIQDEALPTQSLTPQTYGSQTAIPVIDIDNKGRITHASTVSVATNLNIAADTGIDQIKLLNDTLTFSGGEGLDINIDPNTNTIIFTGEDATSSNKGISSFSAIDFIVTNGNVAINTEYIQDTVGAMVNSNTESGIAVTYDDTNGKLNFDVNDFSITLSGDVSGSGTVTNLGNVTINVDVNANSVALGTDTTGNYVAGITGTTNQISVSGSGVENAIVVLSLPQDIATTSSPTFNGITANGNVIVGGNLTVNGSTITINSTTVTIDDPIFTLGGDTAPTVNDSKDRGIEFKYFDTASKVGFFGYDNSLNGFTFLTSATNNSEVFSGTKGDVYFGNINGVSATLSDNLYVNGNILNSNQNTFSLLTSVPNISVGNSTGTTTINNNLKVIGNFDYNGIKTDSYNSTTVSSTSAVVLDSWNINTYRSGKYLIQIKQGTNYQFEEINVLHNGVTTYFSEYGIIETNLTLCNFSTDISGGQVRLLITMNSASTANIKYTKQLITV